MKAGSVESTPRVAMVNVWSDHNRGDAAIVHATCDAIKRRSPDARIDLHNVVFNHRHTRTQLESHFGSFADTPYRIYPALFPSMTVAGGRAQVSQLARLLYMLRAIVILLLASVKPAWGRLVISREEDETYDALIAADCVVSKGGSYLLANSWKSVIQVSMVLFPLVLGKICGARTALLGVSVGPARSRLAGRVMAFWFNWIDTIVVREQDAYSCCIRLGVPAERLTLLPDFAFLLKVHDATVPAPPLGLRATSRPAVAVTVRRWAFDDLSVSERARQEERYLSGVADALVDFHEQTNAAIVLVPQVIGPGRRGSDLDALDIVQSRIGDRAPVVRMPDDLDFKSLRAVYENVDLLVGTRLHSVILAFGTPTVIIGYQGNKSIGTARLIGNERGFIHINSVNRTDLFDRMMLIWNERDEVRRLAQNTRDRFSAEFKRVLDPVLDQLLTPRGVPSVAVGGGLPTFATKA